MDGIRFRRVHGLLTTIIVTTRGATTTTKCVPKKKRMRVTKKVSEKTKKMKNDIIEVGETDEE